MENLEIPQYFICPISLQIMKDPVTVITGVTYDRGSIEHWLYNSHNTICPVTKQPLPGDSDLTPNHTLRRLIQAWCTTNAAYGIDRIPTPKPALTKFYAINLIKDLSFPNLQLETLRKLESLVMENDRNKSYLVQAGLPKALTSFITSCQKTGEVNGLEEALSLLYPLRSLIGQSREPLSENDEIIDSLMWVLRLDGIHIKSHAACALRTVTKTMNPSWLERMISDFFYTIVGGLRGIISMQGINALLYVMLDACSLARNRIMMVDSGAVFGLIELELKNEEKKTTELILAILFYLCSTADGRAQLLNHAAGIAVITRRILKVSNTADDRAILIISLICKCSGTDGVLIEMLKVGTVAELFMILQADCATHLKDKAREILRKHNHVWKDFRCIEVLSPTNTR